MKVLHVSIWPIGKDSIGGTERYVMNLSSSLKKRSIFSDIIMLSGKRTKINGVRYIPINISETKKFDEYSVREQFFSNFNEKSLKKFAKIIDQNTDFSGYDVIHFNSLLFYFCATEKKRIFTLHENPIEFQNNWGKNSFKVISKIIKKDKISSTVFVAPSKHYASQFKKYFSKKITAIPHSINVYSKTKNTLPSKNGKLTIFVPSRLEIKQKGQDILLKSIAKIKHNFPKIHVILSGFDNQYKKNIEILKRIKGFEGVKLSFKNISPSKMGLAYKTSDLVVLPSRYESFGYSALESLYIGKRTILSDIPTYREISKDNDLAYITKNNPSSLAKTIIKVAKSNKKSCGNKKWKEKYSETTWVKNYINLYKSCLSK